MRRKISYPAPQHRADVRAGVEPVHGLAPGLEVREHGREALGGREVGAGDVVTVYHDWQLRVTLQKKYFTNYAENISSHPANNLSLPSFGDERSDVGGGWEDDGLVRGDEDVLAVLHLPHSLHLHQHPRPRDPVQHDGEVDADTSEDSVVKLREQAHEETNKTGNEIQPYNKEIVSTSGSRLGGLTFAGPDGHDDLVLHAEDDGRDDDRGQRRLGDEGAQRHQEGEAEQHQGAGVDPAHGSLDAAKKYLLVGEKIFYSSAPGAVDRRPGEGAGGWHGGHEGAHQVADTEGHHLLTSVHRLSSCCWTNKNKYNVNWSCPSISYRKP